MLTLDLPTAYLRTNFDRKSGFRESFSSKARSVGHAITSKTTDLNLKLVTVSTSVLLIIHRRR